jgi:putative ABC transport system substrate-binding protein
MASARERLKGYFQAAGQPYVVCVCSGVKQTSLHGKTKVTLRAVVLILCLVLIIIFLTPLSSEAQRLGKTHRLAFLAFGSPPPNPAPPEFPFEAFRQRLQELGYIEGQNLVIERRYARGKLEMLPVFAAELVQDRVDIIVTSGASAVRAAQQATVTIPIVMAGAPDPVAFGLVASLARPGANVTGLSDSAGREIEGKRLELLKESFPRIARVAVILDSASRVDVTPVEEAARVLGLKLLLSPETATPEEFHSSFALLKREGAQALYAPETPINVRHRALIVELAAKNQLPAMYGSREFVEGGGLMSYGPNFSDIFRRAAVYVDRILKGAKPAELPVEQPSKFELLINLKTAKQIGVKIPPAVLMGADKVIK